MEIDSMQLDKILLTVFISVLAGFFTAAISIVKLVNDKENKTTDYRQAWTDSLRKCFAELICNINLLAGSITSRLSAADDANQITKHAIEREEINEDLPPSLNNLQSYLDKKLLDESAHIRELLRNLHQSYALVRLHFKPNDLSFSRVEQKFDVIVDMLEKLAEMKGKEKEPERMALREKLHTAASEITGYSRDILKIEWEAVKKGERAYQQTKKWSIIGGGIALFILFIFSLVTAWTILKNDSTLLRDRPKPTTTETTANNGSGLSSTEPMPPASAPSQNTQVITITAQPTCQINSKSKSTQPTQPILKKPCSDSSN